MRQAITASVAGMAIGVALFVAGSPYAGVTLGISRTDDWTAVTIAFAAAGGSGFFNLF